MARKTNSHGKELEWTWDTSHRNDFIDLVNDFKDVKFHRNFSSGTAVIRGSKLFSTDQHFWEVEMMSPVYGTDVMVGVGTPEADVSQVRDKFISFLGMNNQTWGLSYTGLFHHNGKSRVYSPRFEQGSVIGVHLDLWNGTLSYYKNKKHLGIASRGLKGKTLYAMASSTAACSSMRIVSTCSFPSSLQFLCCATLRELIPNDKNVIEELVLPPGLKIFLKNNLSWLLDRNRFETSLSQRRFQPSELDRLFYYAYNGINYGREEFNYERELRRRLDMINDRERVHVTNGSFILHNFNRFRRSTEEISVQSHRNCITGHKNNSVQEDSVQCTVPSDHPRRGTLVVGQEATSGEHENFAEASTSGEDNEHSEESSAKRKRYSYNYVVGLSDPDSE